MRVALLFITAGMLAGCNLFEPVTAVDPTQDAGADLTTIDVSDPPDIAEDTGDAAMQVQDTDTPEPDVDTGDCVPESGQELCAAHGAECGELLVPADDADTTRYEAEDLPQNSCGSAGEGFISLCSTSHWVEATHTFPTDGTYRVRVGARGDTPSLVEPRIKIEVDGEEVARSALPPNAVTEVERDLEFVAGTHTIRVQFLNDGYDSEIGDRNADIDFIELQGPVQVPTDRCGDPRPVTCGECSDAELCGRMHVYQCECRCPLDEGCATVGPHPTDPCLACSPEGWVGASGVCADDDDACTIDRCDSDLGACGHEAITCTAGVCEEASCDPTTGMCQTSTAPDGTNCGAMGVCDQGVCGCPDGTTSENKCGDSIDDDCDGDVDCADVDCEGSSCGMGMFCTAGVCG